MADNDKPTAPPVGELPKTPPAAAPKLNPREHARKMDGERLAVLDGAEKNRQQFHVDMKKHLAEANSEQNDSADPHPYVHEHAALRSFATVMVVDPQSMQKVERPCWQMQALVARFHAHGMRHDARISHEMFERALHETLHGRV